MDFYVVNGSQLRPTTASRSPWNAYQKMHFTSYQLGKGSPSLNIKARHVGETIPWRPVVSSQDRKFHTAIKQRINVHCSCHVKVIRNRQEAGVQRAGFLVWPCLHLPWDTREVLSSQKGLRALNQKTKELNKMNPNYTGLPSNGILLNLAWKPTGPRQLAWCSSPATLSTGRD